MDYFGPSKRSRNHMTKLRLLLRMTSRQMKSRQSQIVARRQKVKTSWYLGTQQICRRAWARMLGIGQSRLQRTRHSWQGLDERTLPGWTITPVDQPVLQMLFAFFQMVYDCMTNNLTSQSLISAGAQPRSALMTASVNAFMYKTYYSISETMPTRLGNHLVLILWWTFGVRI